MVQMIFYQRRQQPAIFFVFGGHTFFFFARTFIIKRKSGWTSREVTESKSQVWLLLLPVQACAAGSKVGKTQAHPFNVSEDGRETGSGQVTREGSCLISLSDHNNHPSGS